MGRKHLDMSEAERIEHTRKLAAARARKYYESKKNTILEKRKEGREHCRELIREDEREKQVEEDKKRAERPSHKKVTVGVTIREDGRKTLKTREMPIYDIEQLKTRYNELQLDNGNKSTNKTDMTGINNLFRITGCENIVDCLTNFKKIKKELSEGTTKAGATYGIDAIVVMAKVVRKIVTKIPEIKYPREIVDEYEEFYHILVEKSKIYHENKKKGETIPSWDKYLNKVLEKYDEDSMQFLVSSIYSCVPVRDDLYMKIIESDSGNKNEKQNYIVVPENKSKNVIVIINNYKTVKKYKFGHKYPLTKFISGIVRNYIGKHKLEYDDFLWKQEKLSTYVSTLNKSLGIESIKEKLGVKVYRRMTTSAGIPDDATPEQMVKLAKKMLHSVRSQELYRRTIDDE